MPLYEYHCGKCQHTFEELVSGDGEARCPKCEDARVKRVLSVTARSRSEAAAAELPGPCGSCGHPDGPGSCRFDA